MHKVKVRCKCLVSGFPSIEEEYKIGDFKLCYLKLDFKKFKINKNLQEFDLNGFLLFCQYTLESDGNYYINYFENQELFEIELNDDDYKKIQERTNIDIKKYDIILDKIKTLERKIKLELNIHVAIHIACIEFLDDNLNVTNFYNLLFSKPFWFRLKELDNEFNNNTRFHLNFELINNIKNERLNRAFEFFYDSFDSDKIEIRYILLFTSLECLFNLNGKDITETLSNYVAKIMSLFDESKYDTVFKRIKKLYKIRSNYIHGSKNVTISSQDEKELRRIVRQVLIFYYLIFFSKKFSYKKMLDYLNDVDSIDINDRLILKTILSKSFEEQQLGVLAEIEKEINVPTSFKERIYEGIEKNKSDE